jgi:hypothetical protein
MKALTIVLTKRRLQRLYASNATIIKSKLEGSMCTQKTMKGKNER